MEKLKELFQRIGHYGPSRLISRSDALRGFFCDGSNGGHRFVPDNPDGEKVENPCPNSTLSELDDEHIWLLCTVRDYELCDACYRRQLAAADVEEKKEKKEKRKKEEKKE